MGNEKLEAVRRTIQANLVEMSNVDGRGEMSSEQIDEQPVDDESHPGTYYTVAYQINPPTSDGVLLNPCEHIKKVPPRHQSYNFGSTLNVIYRKLKAIGFQFLLHTYSA